MRQTGLQPQIIKTGLIPDMAETGPTPGNSKIELQPDRDSPEINLQVETSEIVLRQPTLETDLQPDMAETRLKTGLQADMAEINFRLEMLVIGLRAGMAETKLQLESVRTGLRPEIPKTGLRLDLVEINPRADSPKIGLQRAEEDSPPQGTREPDDPRMAAASLLTAVHHPREARSVAWAVAAQLCRTVAEELPAAAVGTAALGAVVAGTAVAVEVVVAVGAEAADDNYYCTSVMNTSKRSSVVNASPKRTLFSHYSSLFLVLAFSSPIAVSAANPGQVGKLFATPEDAVSALESAATSHNAAELKEIFGPAAADIENPDRVQATNEFNQFTTALKLKNQLVHESDTKYVLEVGTNSWPFPVPIVEQDGRWFFDTAAGKEEILDRRIGNNELAVLGGMRGYVDAQREYAGKDRNNDDVLEYAQKLISSPGKKDGLYWPPDLDGEISPLGPMVVDAQAAGYTVHVRGQEVSYKPFHGYYFKILTRQGSHAPGGAYNYVINGHMIGGFGLVAWPAEYGVSGIMTFIVNQRGRVYQQDLGPDTARLATAITAYDPGPGWKVSPD